MNCIIRIYAVFTLVLFNFNLLQEVSARSKLGGLIYSINRPDSIYHDSSAQFSIKIENVSDKVINLQTDSILVEVIIRGVVGRGFDHSDRKYNQKVIVDDKVVPKGIAPDQVYCKKFKIDSLLFPKVTTIPASQNNLSNCKTKIDSLLESNIGLNTRLYEIAPIIKGRYEMTIRINIVEKNGKWPNYSVVGDIDVF